MVQYMKKLYSCTEILSVLCQVWGCLRCIVELDVRVLGVNVCKVKGMCQVY